MSSRYVPPFRSSVKTRLEEEPTPSGPAPGHILYQDPDNPQAMPGTVYGGGTGTPNGLPGYGIGENKPGYRGYNPRGDPEPPFGYPYLDYPIDDRDVGEQPYDVTDDEGIDRTNDPIMQIPRPAGRTQSVEDTKVPYNQSGRIIYNDPDSPQAMPTGQDPLPNTDRANMTSNPPKRPRYIVPYNPDTGEVGTEGTKEAVPGKAMRNPFTGDVYTPNSPWALYKAEEDPELHQYMQHQRSSPEEREQQWIEQTLWSNGLTADKQTREIYDQKGVLVGKLPDF